MGEIKLRLGYIPLKRSKSRERAKELIKSGNVTVNGRVIDKPSYDTEENDIIGIIRTVEIRRTRRT